MPHKPFLSNIGAESETIPRSLFSCYVIASMFMLCTSPIAAASHVYHFQAAGNVLATLELSSLPATESEILGLTFSPAGELMYDLGPVYLGNFDTASHPVDEVVAGRLGCPTCAPATDAQFFDSNPPPSGPLQLTGVQLVFGNEPASSGLFRIHPLAFFGDPQGDWVSVVPEPSSLLLGSIVFMWAGFGRRSKRRFDGCN